MKLGADRKKIAWLAGLLVVAAVVFYMNSSSSDSSPAPAPRAAAVPAAVAPATRANGPSAGRRRAGSKSAVSEFKVVLGPRNPEDRVDPATIDPTLRLDLLAKVQNVEPGPPGRNLFQFGAAPAPPPSALPPVPKGIPQIAVNHPPATAPPLAPAGPPPPPSAPPMTFKYYGYQVSKSDGHKAAFLLDGEDILIAGENDTMKRRYKIVKIGVSSITIEDTQFKSTQTLPLQENLGV